MFKQNVIVVTIAYRLSILGFFTSLDGESPGNFGLMDQSAAFMWIKNNIKAFGGNEENVSIMGHGSGGASVCLHLTSKDWSEDLFHKAIIMSGTSLSRDTVQPAKYYAKAVDRTAHGFSCNRRPTAKMLECLRNVDAKLLVEHAPDQHWGPIIDENLSNTTMAFISDEPEMLIERGHLRKVPIIIGFTNQEEAYDLMAEHLVEQGITLDMYELMINEIVTNDFTRLENNETTCAGNNQVAMEAVNFLYKPYPMTEDKLLLRNFFLNFLNDRKYFAPTIGLAAHMSRQADTFVYRFDLKPKTMIDLPEDLGVPHGFEQIFLWGLPYWGTHVNMTWHNNDKRVTDIVMTLWANFIKSTNPTQLGVYLKWEKFTHDNPDILIIDRSFNMSNIMSLNHYAIKFWNEYYPTVMGFATQCCNTTDEYMQGSSSERLKHYYTFTMILLVGQLLVYYYHAMLT